MLIGPDIEEPFVEVSSDGSFLTSVGKVLGTTSSIDIDAFNFSSASSLRYFRLRDDPDEGNSTGPSVGADVDAVGAITTRPVPSSGTVALMSLGLAGIGYQRRRMTRQQSRFPTMGFSMNPVTVPGYLFVDEDLKFAAEQICSCFGRSDR